MTRLPCIRAGRSATAIVENNSIFSHLFTPNFYRMQKVLSFLICFFSLSVMQAQDAKSLLGKWQVESMGFPNGNVIQKADRETMVAEIMKESKNEALSIDNDFSEQDSLDALREATFLVKGMFDAVQEYQPKGVFLYHGWNEKENWAPIVLKGTYTYDPAKKQLSTVINGKTNKYVVSKAGDNLKLSRADKSYVLLAKTPG
jgi:hypothetical protein